MLTIFGDRHRFCDGVTRRNFLKIGSLALGGLSLPQILEAEASTRSRLGHKAIIMIYLPGGPSHQDLVDLKPDAPDGIRGEFKPIGTNLPGVHICEHLPLLARMLDKVTIIRSIVGCSGAHESIQCLSGHTRNGQPVGGWPSLGSVLSKIEGPTHPAMPPFVGLAPRMGHAPWSDPGRPGYLGLGYAPFMPEEGGRDSLALRGVTMDQMHERKALLTSFDTVRRDLEDAAPVDGMDKFKQRAFELLTSSRLSQALDITREDPKIRERYGRGSRANRGDGGAPNVEQFLMARRMVEAGVRCVTLAFSRWDWHKRNFHWLRQDLPILDRGLTALLQDLHERGLDKDVSVVVWGEFGRTPTINADGGRDHWTCVSCALLAGGGMRHGQVIGSTDKQAGQPQDRPVHFQEVFATLYKQLGIDPVHTILHDTVSRPQHLVDSGYLPIKELV